ncbi:MAG: capsular polysaccharide synthesis protein [Anderseniella sp.]|jgi:hypothetical protein|nr:capsular polysaccharide synthesis protein [Anderseniella sp.]
MLLPKVIWIFWMQGELAAPELVKRCIASWRKLNPCWETVVLDENNYQDYVDIGIKQDDFRQLGIPMRSDLLRLALLDRYGGVWVDATVLCWLPLDLFVHAYVSGSGFFAFSRSRGERVISSWFLAAIPNHPIIRRWKQCLCQYFILNPPCYDHSKVSMICHKLFREVFRLNSALTLLWLRPGIIRLSGRYPYFLLHYFFRALISSDNEIKELWGLTPKISSQPCKTLSKIASEPAPDAQTAKYILDEASYMFKLSHKSKPLQVVKNGSWLDFVFRYVNGDARGGQV